MTDLATPTTAGAADNRSTANLDMLMDVPLKISVELGRTKMTLRQTTSNSSRAR